jgi:hypothetical protein
MRIIKVFLISTLFFVPIAFADNVCSPTDCMVGPLQFGLEYSDEFNLIINTHWTNYLTPRNAFGFEVDFGGYEFRLGGTLAHAFSDQQRVKISAEHLAQVFTFDFVSGDKDNWAGQNSFGAAYEFLPFQSWLKNIEIGGYYADTETETFDNKIFTTPAGAFTNIRGFAGAESYDVYAGSVFSPWWSTRIGTTLFYDHVNYNPRYVSADDSSGVGAAVSLEQLLTNHWKVDLLANPRRPFQRYIAEVSWLIPTRPGTRLEIGINASHLTGDIFTSTDNRVMLGLSYSWDGDPCGPQSNYANDNPDSLITWASQPVGHMPAVLVQKDETVISGKVPLLRHSVIATPQGQSNPEN